MKDELNRRLDLWQSLKKQYGTEGVKPSVLHETRIFRGGTGTWRDTRETEKIAPNGITIGVLHTGRHYPDDWADTSVLYHYPQTERHPSFDYNEIDATKNAGRLGLPIFVITHNEVRQNL